MQLYQHGPLDLAERDQLEIDIWGVPGGMPSLGWHPLYGTLLSLKLDLSPHF